MSDFAKEVVLLVERLVTPRNVFVIMFFKTEFEDVWTSCDEMCGEFKFQAGLDTGHNPLQGRRFVRSVGIQKSAFVIADVSKLSANVFYELGYTRALGKKVILTAKKRTELPFDVGDVPTIFWVNRGELKDRLRKVHYWLGGHGR